jgi:ribonuclease BN (tRNA processing enzyme)
LPPGESFTLGERSLRSIPVSHSVPAVGYLIGNGRASFAFSGDTSSTGAYWQALNACADLRHVIIETSFLDAEEALSRLSGHLCPRLLAQELKKLNRAADVYITHLMPGEEEAIMAEIRSHLPDNPPQALRAGMVFEL